MIGKTRPIRTVVVYGGLVAAMMVPAMAADSVPQNDILNATLWVSNSVEYKGNTLGVYELAKIRLDQALADKSWSALGQTDAGDKPAAVILDADETAIDNGGYESRLGKG